MPYSFECVGETPIDKYLTLRQKENVARTQEDILHMVESVCLVKMMKLKYFFEKMKESLPPSASIGPEQQMLPRTCGKGASW